MWTIRSSAVQNYIFGCFFSFVNVYCATAIDDTFFLSIMFVEKFKMTNQMLPTQLSFAPLSSIKREKNKSIQIKPTYTEICCLPDGEKNKTKQN